MQNFEDIIKQIDDYELELPANDWEILSQKINKKRRKAFPLWWYATAAGVALLVGFGILFFDYGIKNSPQITQINTDDNLKNQPKDLTAENFVGTDLQSVASTGGTPIKNRRKQENNNILNEKQQKATTKNQKPTNDNQQPTTINQQQPTTNNQKSTTTNNQQPISIEEAEKLMAEKENQLTENKKSKQQQSTNKYYASLSASASPTTFGQKETANKFISDINGTYAIMRNITPETKYDLPLTFAFTFGIPLAKRLYLNTGIQYTYIHSKTETFDSNTRNLTSRDNQELHYLGIPLLLSYRIIDGKIFKLYVSGGGAAEKGLLEKHNIQSFDEKNIENMTLPLDNKNKTIPGFQFSLNANIGASITLFKGLALYAEPGLAWYIPATKYPQPVSLRTKNPFFFNITAGLRYNFEK